MRHTALVLAVVLGLVVGAVPAGAVSANATAPADVSTAQQQCSFPVTATDATGTEVTIEERPERIVALQASTAQVMWEIGAQDRVVGMPVREYTAYLNGSEEKTDVLTQDGSGIDVEQVVALEPDVVISPDVVPNETVEQLRNAGVTVYKSGIDTSIEGIYEKTELYGSLVGNCEEAAATVEETRSTVEEVRSAVEGRENPRVLYYFYNFTAGDDTFIDEIIETAGGDNVAANAGISGYAEVNREVVAEADPQWIFHPDDAPLPTGAPYTSTTALQEDQTLTLNANYMNQAGPRFVVPLLEIAETLHPEAFENGTTTPGETETDQTEASDDEQMTTTTAGSTDDTATAEPVATDGGETTSETTTSSGSGPGFGVVAAVVALVAAALLARRD